METVGNPTEEIQVTPGYEEFFDEVMAHVKSIGINEQLGIMLKQLSLSFPQRYDLSAFDIDSGKAYERIFLGKDASGWEVLVMTWRKGRHSNVHGHPEFASYNFLKGRVKIELFEDRTGHGDLVMTRELEMDENTGIYGIGDSDDMSNHIHRVTCISDISISLHIYSDDARKGYTYTPD